MLDSNPRRRRQPRRPRRSFLRRLALVGCGVVLACATLEGGLSLASFIYRWHRVPRVTTPFNASHRVLADRVVCLGDSYTFGVGAPAGLSYPEQLERLLSASGRAHPLFVENDGVPANNSAQILERLPSILARARPRVVLLLVGANDRWNATHATSELPNASRFSQWWGVDAGQTRTFRLLQWLWLGLARRYLNWREGQAHERLWTYLWLDQPVTAAEQTLTRLQRGPPTEITLITMAGIYLGQRRFDEALAAYQRALAINPHNDLAYTGLALRQLLMGTFVGVEPLVAKALACNPRSLSAYRLLTTYYMLVDRPEEAQQALQKARALDPTVEEDDLSRIALGIAPHPIDAYVERWLRRDLNTLVTMVQRSGAEPVLLTYPHPNGPQMVSGIIRSVGAQRGVTVIDLEARFLSLPTAQRNSLFAEDHFHPNAAGYHRVAQYIEQDFFSSHP